MISLTVDKLTTKKEDYSTCDLSVLQKQSSNYLFHNVDQ